jgi:hypothetical protein
MRPTPAPHPYGATPYETLENSRLDRNSILRALYPSPPVSSISGRLLSDVVPHIDPMDLSISTAF